MQNAVYAAMLALVAQGCTPAEEVDPQDAIDAGIADYEALKAQLDENLVEVKQGKVYAISPRAAGGRLYNLDGGVGDPGPEVTMLGLDDGQWTTCGRHAGPLSTPNMAASDTTIAWAGGDKDIRIVDVDDDGCEEIGVVTGLARPPADLFWWSYAVLGDEVWVVVEGDAHEVYAVRNQQSELVGTLEDAGVEFASYFGFHVVGDEYLVVVESGRVWVVERDSWSATFTGHEFEQAAGIALADDGVLFGVSTGVRWFEIATGELRNLNDEIEAGSFVANSVYEGAHHVADEIYLAMVGRRVIYRGVQGIFSYDLDTGEQDTLLLDARDGSQTWVSVHMVGGVLFALEFADTEYTVYRVDHPSLPHGLSWP